MDATGGLSICINNAHLNSGYKIWIKIKNGINKMMSMKNDQLHFILMSYDQCCPRSGFPKKFQFPFRHSFQFFNRSSSRSVCRSENSVVPVPVPKLVPKNEKFQFPFQEPFQKIDRSSSRSKFFQKKKFFLIWLAPQAKIF